MRDISELSLHFLQELVRLDTSNPPGNEVLVANYLQALFDREGIPYQIIEAAPGRANSIARLKGDGNGEPLLLLSHIDVMPVEGQDWDHPPFEASIVDGYVWGRGTVDTKQITAIQLAFLVQAHRSGKKLNRDLILAATADEEAGSTYGLKYLVDNHYDLIECGYALNEGGGFGFRVGEKNLYACQVAETGDCHVRIKATGRRCRSAEADDQVALYRLCRVVNRLSQLEFDIVPTATVTEMMRRYSEVGTDAEKTHVKNIFDPMLGAEARAALAGAAMFGALLGSTTRNKITVNKLQAGEHYFRPPQEAYAEAQIQLLPGQTIEGVLEKIGPSLEEGVEIELLSAGEPFETDFTNPLFQNLETALREQDPESMLIPTMLPGGTDGRHLAAKKVKVHGFMPMKPEDGWNPLALAHAPNERISVANVNLGSRVFQQAVARFCGISED